MTEDEKAANGSRNLHILFPGKEVKTPNGDHVAMIKPLSLKDLPKVADAFGALMKKVTTPGYTKSDLAIEATKDILELLPYCIDEDPDKIPACYVPEILEIVIEQNITDSLVGKVKALIDKLSALGEGVLEKGKNSGQSQKKKQTSSKQ